MKYTITQDRIYLIASAVADPLGIDVVDVRQSDHGPTLGIAVVIQCRGRDTTVGDCATIHRLLQTRLSITEGNRDIEMEVSTPGIQRTLRDASEFRLFLGRRCRVYDSTRSNWLEGIVASVGDDSVNFTLVSEDDKPGVIESVSIAFENIQKAKLAYAWEDGSRCPTN